MVYLTRGKQLSAIYKRDAHRVRTAIETRDRGARRERLRVVKDRTAEVATAQLADPARAASVAVPQRLELPRFDPTARHRMFQFQKGSRS